MPTGVRKRDGLLKRAWVWMFGWGWVGTAVDLGLGFMAIGFLVHDFFSPAARRHRREYEEYMREWKLRNPPPPL